MRSRIVQMVNGFLALLGIKIVRIASDTFDMASAVDRIVGHGMPIRSVIDIGASDGKWSVSTIKTFPKASFLAIEPLSERQGALEMLKRQHENFDYVSCVAGAQDGGEVSLSVSDDLDGSTVDGHGEKSRRVPVRTIDALVREKKLDGPFLLKFDTHGYEISILAGAKDALQKTGVIIMEVYNFKVTENALRFYEMCIYMEQLGFRCYDIAGPMLRRHDKAFWQMDIFFVRSDSKILSYSKYS